MKMLFPLLTSRNHYMTLHSLTTYVHLIYTNVIDNKSYRILELQFNTFSWISRPWIDVLDSTFVVIGWFVDHHCFTIHDKIIIVSRLLWGLHAIGVEGFWVSRYLVAHPLQCGSSCKVTSFYLYVSPMWIWNVCSVPSHVDIFYLSDYNKRCSFIV
jgi:hypothetical protein